MPADLTTGGDAQNGNRYLPVAYEGLRTQPPEEQRRAEQRGEE